MLVRFTVENILSIRDREELSLVASRLRGHEDHIIRPEDSDGFALLKVAVIYGANASGKTNLVRALDTAQRFILRPLEAEKPIPIIPFKLDDERVGARSRFEFEIKCKGRYFAYGFVVSQERVEEEWLYRVGQQTEQPIFTRQRNKFAFPGMVFLDKEHEQFTSFTAKGTLPNRLFLTECRERNVKNNVPEAAFLFDVLDWFDNTLTVVFPHSKYTGLAFRIHENNDFKQKLTSYLKCFDTGIEAIDLEKEDFAAIKLPAEVKQLAKKAAAEHGQILLTDEQNSHWLIESKDSSLIAWRLVARHTSRNAKSLVTFDLKEESDGTRRLMDLVPAMMALLDGGRVFVIDELDRSLHPDIAHTYIDNFLRYSQGRESQLIVTTHETTLLEQKFLRADEIWMVDKGADQATKLVALAEYKEAQIKDVAKDYRQGRFGGVPVLRDFSWLENGNATRTKGV